MTLMIAKNNLSGYPQIAVKLFDRHYGGNA
jgi:hypothetical protein